MSDRPFAGPGPAALEPQWAALLERVVVQYRAALGEDLVALACFGSVARGQAGPQSDLDLYVVTRSPISVLGDPRIGRLDAIERDPAYRALQEAGYHPDPRPIFHSVEALRKHPWILLDIAHHGLVLHDPDGVLTAELDAVRRRLCELGARRLERPDGSWYWDLKPDWRPGDRIEL